MTLLSKWSDKSHTYTSHEKNLPNESIVVYNSFMTSLFTERKSKKKIISLIFFLLCCVVLFIFVRFILLKKKVAANHYIYSVYRKIKSSRIKVVHSNNFSSMFIPVSFINRFGIDSMLIFVSFLKWLKSDSNGICNR